MTTKNDRIEALFKHVAKFPVDPTINREWLLRELHALLVNGPSELSPIATKASPKPVLYLHDSMFSLGALSADHIAKMTGMTVITGPGDPTVHAINYRDDTVACEQIMREPYVVTDDLDQVSCPACRQEMLHE